MTDTHHAMIKANQRGRLRFAPDQRASLLAAYDSSGLSGPKFAQFHGLNESTQRVGIGICWREVHR